MSDMADHARELADVYAAITRLGEEHRLATGLPALHVGRCTRPDLDEQYVALYARAKTLTQLKAGPGGRRAAGISKR